MNAHIFPSFSKQNTSEFIRNILLGEFRNAKLFCFKKIDFSFLSVFLSLKVNDQSKEMKMINFKWGIECFLNLIHKPKIHPKVPFDFSKIHPELNSPNILINFAQSYPDRLLCLLENFPYEFYKNIRELNPKNAINFIISCVNNPDINLFIISKLISLFPLNELQFEMEYIMEKRCLDFFSFCNLFEGLLCCIESKQINAFQIMCNHFDSLMNNQTIVLINSSIRANEFFVDKNIALSTNLFPDLLVLPFLLQISSTPINQLLNAINSLESNKFNQRLQSFLLLSSFLGIEGKYEQLTQFSVPFLLGIERMTHDFTKVFSRNTKMFFVTKKDWNIDYDFIQYFIIIKSSIENSDAILLSKQIILDLFSLLFIRTKSNLYYFDLEKAYKIITKINECGLFPNEYQKYIDKAIFKCKAVMFLFDKPNFNHLFLPEQYLYQKSLESLSLFQSVINISNDYPNFVLSKIFSLKVLEKCKIESENNLNPFHGRKEKESMKILYKPFLEGFSEEQKEIFLLDLSSSYEEFTMLCNEIKPIYHSDFIKNIIRKERIFPKIVNLNQIKTTPDFISRLNTILLFDLPLNSFLKNFCLYLKKIIDPFGVLSESIQVLPEKIINSFKSLDEAKHFFQNINYDIEKIIFSSSYSENINNIFLKQLINEYPLFGIPLGITKLSNQDVYNEITKKNFNIVKKYIQNASKKEDNETDLDDIIKRLKYIDQHDVMLILDDLIYSYDLENYYDQIIIIIEKFPVDWCLQFLETFLLLLPKNSIILIPLSQKINELKLKYESTKNSEIERTCVQFNYFLKISSNFDNLFQNPEKIYRLSFYHLQNHIIGNDFTLMIQKFTKIIIFIKNTKIFSSLEDEKRWINNYIFNDLTKLNNRILSRMIIDIGLNYSFEYGLELSNMFNLDYTESIVEKLPHSIQLFSYFPEPSHLIEYALSIQVIDSQEKEIQLIKFLSKMKKYVKRSLKYDVLFKLCNDFTFQKTRIVYSGKDIKILRDIAEKIDQKDIILLLENNNITLSKEYKTKFNNIKNIFSVGINEQDNYKLVFNDTKISFELNLNDFKSSQQSMYMFNINDKSITFSRNKEYNNYHFKFYIPPDFEFYDLNYLSFPFGINKDTQKPFLDTFSIQNVKKENNEKENLNVNDINDLFNIVSEHLQQSSLNNMFKVLTNYSLHILLEYANQNSLIYFILKLVLYVIDYPEKYEIFIFPQSILKKETKENLKTKLNDFIISLKATLISAIRFTKYIKNELLFPSSIILNGNIKDLNDLSLIFEYQNQIGISKISLFNPDVDKSSVISQLFIKYDFEKGFALARILHVDVDDVTIKAAAHFAESSIHDLGLFLFNVIPKLSPESANKLIETFSSILCRDEQNRMLFKQLILRIDEPKTIYHILRCFGEDEGAALFALQENLSDEIEITLRDAKRKRQTKIVTACNRWKSAYEESANTIYK